jgi:hypothetical protein
MLNRLKAAVKAFRTPYDDPPPEQEQDWQSGMAEQVKREAQSLALLSKTMLQDARYTQMRMVYQRLLEQSIRLMIWYDAPSAHAQPIVAYFESMRKFQLQLRALTQIVEMPKEFAARAQAESQPSPVKPAEAFAP